MWTRDAEHERLTPAPRVTAGSGAPGKASAAMGFAAIEEIFSPSAGRAREMRQEQKRVGQRAPTPGDWLDDGDGVVAGGDSPLSEAANEPGCGWWPGFGSEQLKWRLDASAARISAMFS
jgi:hypothetical protein